MGLFIYTILVLAVSQPVVWGVSRLLGVLWYVAGCVVDRVSDELLIEYARMTAVSFGEYYLCGGTRNG